MALLSLQNITLGFGGAPLLENISLHIEKGERICLLGRNGTGKTTIMKIISGEVHPDTGEVLSERDVTAAILPQHVPDNLNGRVSEIIAKSFGPEGEKLATYEELLLKAENDHSPALAKEIESLEYHLNTHGGWEIKRKVEKIISQMSLPANLMANELSAGLKRRVLLAKCLASEPDILLLDEPTNHLDIESIILIEDFLLRYKGTTLFVTHDRAFLRKLATRIIEIDRGALNSFPTDYDTYLKRKEHELEVEEKQNINFDKKLAKEEKWIRQGILARRTRNEGRVRALKKLREVRAARRSRQGKVSLEVNESQKSGKLVIEAKNLSFSYPGQEILKSFSTTIMRGDKIGIIGPNGIGKTTLIKVLLGDLKSETGSIRFGTNLQVSYFDQLRTKLDENKTVEDNVFDGSDKMTINGRDRHVIGYLQDFLFTKDRAKSPVNQLSGGEKNRLLLAKLFSNPTNILVFDEPTNDLDYETIELLEVLLINFEGTILIVSHDRSFLNNVVTSTIAFDAEGSLSEYVGGYDDYLRQSGGFKKSIQEKDKKPVIREKKEKPRKLSFKEKNELSELPPKIERLEGEEKNLYDKMSDPDFYKKSPDEIKDVKDRIESIKKELEESYLRWEELEEIRLKFESKS